MSIRGMWGPGREVANHSLQYGKLWMEGEARSSASHFGTWVLSLLSLLTPPPTVFAVKPPRLEGEQPPYC